MNRIFLETRMFWLSDGEEIMTLAFYQCVSIASYASAGIARAEMSVRPSVRPSHSGIVSKRRKLASWFLHRPRAWTFYFLEISGSSRNSIGVTPSEGDFWDWGGYKLAILAIFRPINRRIYETVQKIIYALSIHTKINYLGWPWIDLERLLCTLLHYTRLSAPTRKIWMKIDPRYRRRKCSPWITVSSKIRFMQIFGGVRWRGGFKWEWGHRKWRFSLILPAISSKTSHLRPQLL